MTFSLCSRQIPLLLLSSDKYIDVARDWMYNTSRISALSQTPIYILLNSDASRVDLEMFIKCFVPASSSQYVVLSSSDNRWLSSLIYALEVLKNSGYSTCMVFMEDFFFNRIDLSRINSFSEIEFDIIYISPRPRMTSVVKFGQNFYGKICRGYRYGICLQPAVWNVESLLCYSKSLTYSSPWEFEGSSSKSNLKNIYRSLDFCVDYYNQSVEKGQWYPFKYLRYCRFPSSRPVISASKYLFLLFKHSLFSAYESIFRMRAWLCFFFKSLA